MEMPDGFKNGETLIVFHLQDESQVALVSPEYIHRLQEFLKEMAETLEEYSIETMDGYEDPLLQAVQRWKPNKAKIVLERFKEWK